MMFSLKSDYTNKAKAILKEYGNDEIKSITLTRTPLTKVISKILYFVTGGKSKLYHDELYHLAMIVNVKDKLILVEKNEVINIDLNPRTYPNTQIFNVNLQGKKITLNEMLNNARQGLGDAKFWTYEAFTTNCQHFLQSLLKYSGLLTPDADKFIFQDLSEIIKNTPTWARVLTKGITNLAAFGQKLMGTGKKRRRKIKSFADYPKRELLVIADHCNKRMPCKSLCGRRIAEKLENYFSTLEKEFFN